MSDLIRIEKPCLRTAHRALDVEEDQHAVLDRSDGQKVFTVDRRVEGLRFALLLRHERDHIVDTVDDHAQGPRSDAQNDHEGELIAGFARQLVFRSIKNFTYFAL